MGKPLFNPNVIKISDCLTDVVPTGTTPVVTTSWDFNDSGVPVFTQVLGFFDPVTGVLHIQEMEQTSSFTDTN